MRVTCLALAIVSGCGGDQGSDDRHEHGDADADTDSDGQVCEGEQPSPTLGGPCGCDADCDTPEVCGSERQVGYAGGMCIRSCDPESPCPEGFVCDPGYGCFEECTLTSDCRAGMICTSVFEAGEEPRGCYPGMCQADADCTVYPCDPYTAFCGVAEHPGNGATGAECASDRDCLSGMCLQYPEYPGGYCSTVCSVERQGCPEGSRCLPFDAWSVAIVPDDFGICHQSCTSVTDCRDGYSCDAPVRDPDHSYCIGPH